ncbi:hypothetical protein M9H77_16482 [Catharanthus roseus]|uniref:Uncharacterized protein n=1 Tax=Catharanthus roseus TaxID=4058 RepID=A0ACC0B1W9_CATRO|nr:hypothetical protein M9H77_16482 [Catharanthus roseus]
MVDSLLHFNQADLIERFSKSRHLEELHKLAEDKKMQYMDIFSEKFWTKFHEAPKKAEEEAAATSIPIPDDLQLMAIISGGLSRDRLYGAGSNAAHIRAESSGAAAGLPPCCLKAGRAS